MERLFIETGQFSETVDSDGGKDFLEIIQQEVLKNLELPISKRDVIPGSGGFIKLRVPDARSGKGKSGGWRIVYFDHPQLLVTFLILIYPKSMKENISKDQLKALRTYSQELKQWQPANLKRK
ncbi:type II toxin-antitoxin system RelE/ParE family toxin [Peredibacter sp. HCB2-198]|uniref:type II toxin-antitoxin system RelE/ParE family toxin n=1 Tax=Peredibacter sp. HCB2-198 TaxID=3383025 RepID=UPI0038B4EE57